MILIWAELTYNLSVTRVYKIIKETRPDIDYLIPSDAGDILIEIKKPHDYTADIKRLSLYSEMMDSKDLELFIKYDGSSRELARFLKTGISIQYIKETETKGKFHIIARPKDFSHRKTIPEETRAAIIRAKDNGMTIEAYHF